MRGSGQANPYRRALVLNTFENWNEPLFEAESASGPAPAGFVAGGPSIRRDLLTARGHVAQLHLRAIMRQATHSTLMIPTLCDDPPHLWCASTSYTSVAPAGYTAAATWRTAPSPETSGIVRLVRSEICPADVCAAAALGPGPGAVWRSSRPSDAIELATGEVEVRATALNRGPATPPRFQSRARPQRDLAARSSTRHRSTDGRSFSQHHLRHRPCR